MQKPPIPNKSNGKFFRSSDLIDLLATPPKELSAFSQTPIHLIPEDNIFSIENNNNNEKFNRLLQEKNDEIELLKAKLGAFDVSASQLKATKNKLFQDYEERTTEIRGENNKLKNLLDEKNNEIENLSSKILKYEDMSQENNVLQAKLAESEFSNKKLIAELTKSREINIEFEAENSFLKNEKKTMEAEIKELRNFEKTVSTQILRKNEQIQGLRQYLNNLELKLSDITKIPDLEKNLVLAACEVERLQVILTKKSEEIEFLGKKTLELNKILKSIPDYEKTISNLVIENEKLKSICQKSELDKFKRSSEQEDKNQEESQKKFPKSSKKEPKNEFYRESERKYSNDQQYNKNMDSENQEYHRLVRENIGLVQRMEAVEEELGQMNMVLRGKDKEIQELRSIKKDQILEKTMRYNGEGDTRRKFNE